MLFTPAFPTSRSYGARSRCSRESNIRREVSNWLEERPARFETAGEPVAIASHNRLYSSDDRQGQSGLDLDAAPGRRM